MRLEENSSPGNPESLAVQQSRAIVGSRMGIEGPDDVVVIQRVLGGDADAFRLLVQRYGGRLRRFCFSRLGDPDEADDAVQDVLLRAYRSLGTFRLGSTFASWLFAIAANRVRTRRGRASARDALASRVANAARTTPAIDPAEQAVVRLQREEVRQEVARLAWPLRVVVELYYFAGLSVEDTAAALGLGTEAVKSRLLRARRELARRAADPSQPEPGGEGILP
jgi:RNA polymerase sigma-70 factor (ECF subfamily)